MSDSQTAEDKALEQVDSLVLFASENLKDLPADAIKTIAELRAKQPSGWTPDKSLNFWTSFNKLCLAIKPVTLDTLASNEATIPRPRRVFWRRSDLKISLSKRTAQRYLSLLLILLFLSLAFQFVAATLVGLTSEIEKLLADADKLNAERSEEIVAIESDVGQRKFSDPLLSTEVKKAIASIQDKDNKVKFDVDQALVKANLFQRLATFGLKPLDYFSSRYNPRETIADAKNGIVEYDSVRSSIGRAIDRSSLTLRLLNAVVLPNSLRDSRRLRVCNAFNIRSNQGYHFFRHVAHTIPGQSGARGACRSGCRLRLDRRSCLSITPSLGLRCWLCD